MYMCYNTICNSFCSAHICHGELVLMDNKEIILIKEQTIELYDKLPQNKAERILCTDIRDQIIELNMPFFHYVARRTYIKNDSVEYDDKVQCAMLVFCLIWWQYMWDGEGDDTGRRPNGYPHQGLSFTTFFMPRISSGIRDELQEISYTTRRTTLSKIGHILGKKWTEVELEDLDKIQISPVDMAIARLVLDPNCRVSFEYELLFQAQQNQNISYEISNSDDYNSIEEMLIHETIEKDDRLTNKEIKHLAEILELDYKELIAAYPKALEILAERLKKSIQEHYENEEWWK